MALLAWSSTYSVGVEEMDRQHRVLFNMLNDLHSAMLQGKGQDLTGHLLRMLVDYSRKHFAAEEALMAAAGYVNLATHRMKHKELIKQVDGYVKRYEKGEIAVDLSRMSFLRDWLTDHIQQTDGDYGVCVKTYISARKLGAA